MITIDSAIDTAFGDNSPDGMRDNLEPMVRQLLTIIHDTYGEQMLGDIAEQLCVLREHCIQGEFEEARALCVTNGASPQMVDLMIESIRPYIQT